MADNESNGCTLGQCTLREAVNAANITPGSDTIQFETGLTGTIILTSGALSIASDVTINGPGARTLLVSGNNNSRVFIVSGSGNTVSISGLTITGGNAQPILLGATLIGDGGGILNANGATLNLTEVNITGNSATSFGGGIATRALLLVTTTTNITRSTISNNASVLGGGGISNIGTDLVSSAVTTISNSTVTGNSTLAEGGGISNTAGTMNLTNNTISHNQSVGAGGGIVNVAGLLVGTVYLRNNILAQNSAVLKTDLISSDGLGIFNSLGNNLIGSNFGAEASFAASVFVGTTPQPNVNLDLVGNVVVGNQIIDPLLLPLQNNGGCTDTRAILGSSLAVDRADNCVFTNTCPANPGGGNPPSALPTDQRGDGFTRIFDGDNSGTATVDIGAYEFQLAPTAASVSISGKVTDGGNPIARTVVILTDANGNNRTAVTNQFGNFRFNEVRSGETYIIAASHKAYGFTPQFINVSEDLTDLIISSEKN